MKDLRSVNLDTAGSPGAAYDPFGASAIERVIPSTAAQREIWMVCQFGPEASLAYNESLSLQLIGLLDLASLNQALHALVARHDALRCSFGPDGSELIVNAPGGMSTEALDLRGLGQADQDLAIAAAHQHAVTQPFDLGQGPLLRCVLISRADHEHELVLTAHHIIFDGWSQGVVARDLLGLYRAARGGPALPAAPSFAEYAARQAESAQQALTGLSEDYWIAQFRSGVPVLQLPCDQPRSAQRHFAAQRHDLDVAAEVVEALRMIGARQGASLFSTLFGLFGLLLQRLTGQDDLVIGQPAAGQSAEDMEDLVGHCVHVLPIRLQLPAAATLAVAISTAAHSVLDALEHPHCSLGSLLTRLSVERLPGHLPLVSVLFNLDRRIPAAALSDQELSVALDTHPRYFEHFELFVNLSQHERGITIECQYQTALFDASTIASWMALYQSMLQRAARDPAVPRHALMALSEIDVAHYRASNASERTFERGLSVPEMIGRQVRLTPAAIAVRCGAQQLSYAELEQRASALALVLRGQGAARGSLVGLACERSTGMLIGLYGILKAGAAYVPLDPAFPPQRLNLMAVDAALDVIVTERAWTGPWPFSAARALRLDILAPAEHVVASEACADDLAYVIYTSGSTGQPKGVQVSHRNVVNLLGSLRETPGMDDRDRVLAVTTLSFDISLLEVLLPLTVGACVIVADRNTAMDGHALRALIEAEAVSFINATPSSWQLLLDADWPGQPALRAVCGGEPLSAELARALLGKVGSLWNAYGPTETTVWSSLHRVARGENPIPIGRPIANTRFHILGADGWPVPVGAIGELCIAGNGVTRGYLNRADLTAQRFQTETGAETGTDGPRRVDKTGTDTSTGSLQRAREASNSRPAGETDTPLPVAWTGRMYRTGDLGRLRRDGNLECLGRVDHQIKLRGYRIEPGEIESQLRTLDGIRESLVVAREDVPGDLRLVAYLVAAQSGPPLDLATLRAKLRRSLPDYMIPQHFVALTALPLLPNGKLDRKALPIPGHTPVPDAAQRIAPGDRLEATILAAMESVLNLPGLGIHDDFFLLGGHSLLAAKLASQLQQALGLRLPLQLLFAATSPARLAVAVRTLRQEHQPSGLALRGRPGRSEGPLTPMQARMCFIEELRPDSVVYNTPSAHRLAGAFDLAAFQAALQKLVQRQPVLRTAFRRLGGQAGYRQLIAPTLRVDLPFEDLSHYADECREAELTSRMDAVVATHQSIQHAPLFMVRLFRLAEHEHVFLFVPHHLIWDGFSFDLLYEDLSELYAAALGRHAAALPLLTAAPADYAEWLAGWLDTDAAARQLAFWEQRFAQAPPAAPFNPDRPRSAATHRVGSAVWLALDATRTERLRAIGRHHGVTLSMLVLASYMVLVAAVLRCRNLAIGMPVRGRDQPELEHLMGFFNNLVVVHGTVDGTQTFSDLLGHVKDRLLSILDHQGIPFEVLNQTPAIYRHAQRSGLYQALFSFQDTRQRPTDWGGLRHSGIPLHQDGVSEDVSLGMVDGANGLHGLLQCSDLFDDHTAEDLSLRWQEIVAAILQDAQQPLDQLLADGPSPSARRLFRLGGGAMTGTGPGTPEGGGTADIGDTVATFARHARAERDSALSGGSLQLAQVWSGLLDLPVTEIAERDNFFDLGGDSLRAMLAIDAAATLQGFRVEPPRYVTESLHSLALRPTDVAAMAGSTASTATPQPSLLSRLFGRKPHDHGGEP